MFSYLNLQKENYSSFVHKSLFHAIYQQMKSNKAATLLKLLIEVSSHERENHL